MSKLHRLPPRTDRPTYRVREVLICDGRTVLEAWPFTPGFLPTLPLVKALVPAGFPSPADDYESEPLNLEEHVVRNPDATFFLRVAGRSMEGAGICHGDLAVVDKSLSLEARPGDIVIAEIDGALTLKRLARRGGRLFFDADPAEGEVYAPIPVTGEGEFRLWGVVTFIVKAYRRS